MTFYSNWSEVNKLIDRALELEKEKRIDFLETHCTGDPKLLADAKDYLIHIEQAQQDDSFLESKTMSGSVLYRQLQTEGLAGKGHSILLGRQIGHYRIAKELGEGGMGTVYLAERSDGEFEQQVAIKFLRGYYSPSMRDRFKREKQILARLNHPNIAGLLDGGITDDGTPYMVMEYVEGTPVDVYCKNHSLKLSKRLDLFLQICRAVQHAHSKLIIHRDLKPENIFITDDGQVKVMDFGIGKFLDSELDDDSLLRTHEGHHVASVEFAAPEQFQSGDPSTATDVYGLGVLLYLLLTGEKPFVFKGKSLTEIENLVLLKPPPHPSRHENPAIGVIPSDLDCIILKALRKEPDERYQTVREFSDDLQRFISHQPVVARKGSALYKTRKFVYRNRVVLATASIILIFISGFLTYHLKTINRHMEQTEMEAETARSVTNFIVELFDVSDPIENEAGILTAAALLERGQDRFDDLDMKPEVQLELLSTLGNASMKMGNYVNAERIYFKSDSIARSHFPKNSYQTARSALNLGHILTSHFKYFEAEQHLKEARVFFSNHSEQYWQEYSDLLMWLGTCLLRTNREEEARQAFVQVLDLEERSGPESREALDAQLHLANSYRALGRFESAETIYIDVLEKIEEFGYSRYDIHRSVLNSLGNLNLARKKYDAAELYYKTALDEAVKIYGELHPNSLLLKHNLMFLYVYQKDFERAVPAGHEMLRAKIARHGENNQMTADGHSIMGMIYYTAGNLENAIRHFEKSRSIFDDLLGTDHHWTVNQSIYLALTNLDAGRESAGMELFLLAESRLSDKKVIYDFFAHENFLDYIRHFEEDADSTILGKIEEIKRLASQINS